MTEKEKEWVRLGGKDGVYTWQGGLQSTKRVGKGSRPRCIKDMDVQVDVCAGES